MTDRELLEAAARAAGMRLSWHEATGSAWIEGPQTWNPLTDDGDALRLAARLFINIEHLQTMGGMCAGINCWPIGRGDCGFTQGVDLDDYPAAMRRAIVRAAAAIAQEKTP